MMPKTCYGLLLVLAAAACSRDAVTPMVAPRAAVSTTDSIAPLYGMDRPERVANRFLVRYKDDVRDVKAASEQIARAFGGKVLAAWPGMRGMWLELPDAAIHGLLRNPQIRYVEADYYEHPATVEPAGNWGVDRVDQRRLPVDGSYRYGLTGAGVHLWIVDTGVDANAGELSGRIGFGINFNFLNPYAPCDPHGSDVAVAAAGRTRGIARGATIHSARIDDSNCGDFDVGATVSAINYIADYSPRPAVINYSGGHGCWSGFCWQTADDAVKYAISRGVTVVLAAGNDNRDACDYSPAHVREAITVAASDQTDSRSLYSWDPDHPGSDWGSCVDLFAPGSAILAYSAQAQYGSSIAAPFVAGTAALMLQERPNLSPAQLQQDLLSSATWGVLNPNNLGSGSPNAMLYAPHTLINMGGVTCISSSGTYTWWATVYGDPAASFDWYISYAGGNEEIYPGPTNSPQFTQYVDRAIAPFDVIATINTFDGTQRKTVHVDVCG